MAIKFNLAETICRVSKKLHNQNWNVSTKARIIREWWRRERPHKASVSEPGLSLLIFVITHYKHFTNRAAILIK